ncbi:Autoinducer 2 sensor kinase/phosphatase LuxQ [Pseudobythopirellula maris]|uniref:histidine kinase n=1 Tax=Pseudobythopirellula maris TaxID=2527991 RepID=A0A5C5ZQN1_9BACT|nr:PAS domain S-box protein [Pseudobythopirellula maris]TWT89779.1 Autoinducer 2 sensor kinase/phosphatase LuxQ [Pseudobythopirellula maris]
MKEASIRLSFEATDLAKATADLVEPLRPVVEQAGLRLTVDCPPLPQPVYVDARRWAALVLHLLSDAIRNPAGDEVLVRLVASDGSAVLSITGAGVGFANEGATQGAAKVSDADARTSGEALGVHDSVRESIELLGGETRVVAREGRGSCVVVALPFGFAHLPADHVRGAEQPGANLSVVAAGEPSQPSEWRFQSMADAAPAMLWITDPDGACTFLSNGWYEFTGQTESEALGFGWLDAVHPEDREASGRIFRDANVSREPFSLDYRLRRADGQYRWAIDAGKPRLGEAGRFLGYIGSVIDVHERKLAEEEIRHNAAILEGITKGTREQIAAQSDQYRYIYFNDAYKSTFESLWGTPLVHGVSMLEAMAQWPDEREKARALWGRAHAGETFSVVMEFGPSEAEARVFELQFSPLFGADGDQVGAAHILRDVTDQARMQEALQESELRYRLVGQAANDAIWDWDFTTNAVTWNEGVQTRFDYAASEVGPDATWWIDQIHPADRDKVSHGIHAAIDGGRTHWSDEYRFRKSGGGYATVFDRGTIVHDRDGKPIRMVGSMLDLTERRNTEKRQQFLTELATTTQPLAAPDEVTDQTARLLAEHLGTDRCAYAEVVNEADFVVIGEYSRGVPSIAGRWPVAAFGAECERRMMAGEPFVVEDAETDPHVTSECRPSYEKLSLRAVVCVPLHKNGRLTAAMAVHHTSPRIWRKEEIELVQTVASHCWEAIERSAANRRLRDSEERFRRLVEGSPFGMYVVDSQLQIVHMNSRSQTGAFRNVRPVLGRHIGEVMRILWPEEVAANVVTAFKRTIETGKPYMSKDFVNRRVDVGSVEGYEWELQRLTLADGQLGVICYYFDSSDLHLAHEALREADRRKDEFLATLAHELRNPLAPIRTGLELLKLSKDEPEAAEETRQVMERQTLQLVALVDDLLDVSRITRGKLNLRRKQVSLKEVVRSAVEASTPLIEESGHRLTVRLPDRPTVLHVDPHRMAQVVSNLLTNAAKYTPPGGSIDLGCSVERGEAVVRVKDSGVGIPAEIQQSVFDMFDQGERSLESGHTGLGIGLTLVRSLVEMHGGTVEVESEGAGKGSEFRVRLPLHESPSLTEIEETPDQEDELFPEDFGLRVLVVDDNRGAAHLLGALCEKFGNEVRRASDGRQALEQAADFLPQVVLMDVNMPVMDGCEAARRMRAEPWGAAITLVAVTGNGQVVDRQRSSAAGFDKHLVKPIDATELQRLFTSLLGRLPGV